MVPQQEKGKNRLMSWVSNKDFRSDFYFTHIPFPSNKIDLEMEMEGNEPLRISEIHVYAHPDAMYREFEDGVVLATPSPRPYEFNLGKLFPEQSFRRIEGSPNQDPETNDGSVVKSNKIKLQGKDSLFLIKE